MLFLYTKIKLTTYKKVDFYRAIGSPLVKKSSSLPLNPFPRKMKIISLHPSLLSYMINNLHFELKFKYIKVHQYFQIIVSTKSYIIQEDYLS